MRLAPVCGAIFSASLHELFYADHPSSCILQLCLSATLTKKPWKQVEKATESEPAKSKDLLESEDLERKVVDSKKRITDENTSRPTS